LSTNKSKFTAQKSHKGNVLRADVVIYLHHGIAYTVYVGIRRKRGDSTTHSGKRQTTNIQLLLFLLSLMRRMPWSWPPSE